MADQRQKDRFVETLTGLARSAGGGRLREMVSGKGHLRKTPRAVETLA